MIQVLRSNLSRKCKSNNEKITGNILVEEVDNIEPTKQFSTDVSNNHSVLNIKVRLDEEN